ncbi:nucleolar protein NOP58 [Lineolata rhizophorae]|uniref:Nucleolar protein 58 n=1 Tax=Lineolata rhizophorae TaxID=578093 RepID=A0A6A6P4H6_9PEZI|nr:nucleolar protein NOP58 [Lineolata rhizophorae]
MGLFILTETSAGYVLLKAKDKKLLQRDNLGHDLNTAQSLNNAVKVKTFLKFTNATGALDEAAAVCEGKVTPKLAGLLDSLKDEKKATLAVADSKLGKAINKLPGLSITPVADSSTEDLYRSIRQHISSIIPELVPEDVDSMNLGLSHSLSRHKIKFSPDKVDVMIIQSISLLDDLDKELNLYAMRLKEWYGWHFPELARLLPDNITYARVVLAMGLRSAAPDTDFAEILPEDVEVAVKASADLSMGTEIIKEDLDQCIHLAQQVEYFYGYRQQLAEYLGTRMHALAPNLTALVGELIGARLISQAGSLLKLAKSPGSTIQILGAEKALFRALKTKHDTPKYGLIYHASLIGQATGRNKGKIARMLASKAALGVRVDNLETWGAIAEGEEGPEPTEEQKAELGRLARKKIESRLSKLEGRPLRPEGVQIGPSGQAQNQPGTFEIKETRQYNADADFLPTNGKPSEQEKIGELAKTKKLIQEVNGGSDNIMEDAADGAEDSDESMADASSQDDQPKSTPKSKESKKALKAAEKEEKAQRKAARAAKREERAKKRAAKEEKKAKKEAKAAKSALDETEGKKRKRDEEGNNETKKKRKKEKASK